MYEDCSGMKSQKERLWKSFAMRSSVFWDVNAACGGSFGRFGTTYRPHLQGSNSPKRLDCSSLTDGTDRVWRNVGSYNRTLRNVPEERGSPSLILLSNVLLNRWMLNLTGETERVSVIRPACNFEERTPLPDWPHHSSPSCSASRLQCKICSKRYMLWRTADRQNVYVQQQC